MVQHNIEIIIFTIGPLGVSLSRNIKLFPGTKSLDSISGGGMSIMASAHVLNTVHKNKQGSMIGLLGGMNVIPAVI